MLRALPFYSLLCIIYIERNSNEVRTMLTIKVFLTSGGRIADLKKDFPLYQGQFQNKLLNVYVPTAILAPDFVVHTTDGAAVSPYVAGTAVRIGMEATLSSGKKAISKT